MQIKMEKGSAHPVSTDYKARDGRTIFLVMSYDAEGREYHHDHDFYHWDDADALAKKVNDRGYGDNVLIVSDEPVAADGTINGQGKLF